MLLFREIILLATGGIAFVLFVVFLARLLRPERNRDYVNEADMEADAELAEDETFEEVFNLDANIDNEDADDFASEFDSENEDKVGSGATPRGHAQLDSINNKKFSAGSGSNAGIISINIFPKDDRPFAGYELLQTVLSSGLRYGPMNIFHYYSGAEGSSEILFSLAQATEPGTFNIQRMGGISCAGLTLFQQQKGNDSEKNAAYQQMLEVARQLAEQLEGELFDAKHQPLAAA